MVTPAARAYALLWRSSTDCSFVHAARAELLSTLTKAEQHDAIAWLMKTFGPISTSAMIAADIRAGVFPKQSYMPEPDHD